MDGGLSATDLGWLPVYHLNARNTAAVRADLWHPHVPAFWLQCLIQPYQ
jgi:hypothetical protein